MDGRLVVLQLVLKELGTGSDIRQLKNRKEIQKSIYLGQISGVDLGYRFGWYLLGPYSTSLTRDYYQLSEDMSSKSETPSSRVLKDAVKTRLAKVKPLFEVPKDVNLERDEWLELLASYHYLRKVQKLNVEEASGKLNDQKPKLASFLENAKSGLERHLNLN